jgi:small GTP-binding protein
MKTKERKRMKNYNIITIGDSNSGKTSLVSYYVNNKTIVGQVNSTIGVDFLTKKLKIKQAVKSFTFYDTSGSERFHTMVASYYKNADGVLLLFDLTNEESFAHVKDWADTLLKYKSLEEISLLLVGNKCDLVKNKSEISIAKYESIAKEYQTKFYMTSALTGEGVQECFTDLLNRLVEISPDPNDSDKQENSAQQGNKDVIDLSAPKQEKKSCC